MTFPNHILIQQRRDSNLLVARLLESSLCLAEISPIIRNFFKKYSPQPFSPWKDFLERFHLEELPQIHQVYAALERYTEASQLAESVGEYSHAARYLMGLSGREIAFRILDLSERSGDREVTVQAHQKVAEILWQEGNYKKALFHFQKAGNGVTIQAHQKVAEILCQEGNYRMALFHFQEAGNLERARYCYEKLGELVEDTPRPFQQSSSQAEQSSSNTQQSSSQAEQAALNRHKQELLQLLYGNHKQCMNLLNYERRRSPNKSEIELYKDAIFRLLKDRR